MLPPPTLPTREGTLKRTVASSQRPAPQAERVRSLGRHFSLVLAIRRRDFHDGKKHIASEYLLQLRKNIQ